MTAKISGEAVFTIAICSLLVLAAIGYYWSEKLVGSECIEAKGKAFCNNLNMSFWSNSRTINTDFQCYLDNNRTYVSQDYRYLDSEIKECCIKDAYQFKKGCK